MSTTQIHTDSEATPPDRPNGTIGNQDVRIPAAAIVLVAIVVTAVVVMTLADVPTAAIGAAGLIAAEAVRRLYLAVRS